MKQLLALVTVVWLLLAGCAGFGGPRVVTIDEQQLNALAARAFPIDRRLLDVFDINISAPRLTLHPESNRIATELEVRGADRLFGSSLNGKLAFDSGLRFDPSDQTLRLSEVRVHQLRFEEGGEGPRHATARRLGTTLAELMLENLVIYRLGDDRRARLAQAGLEATAVTVTSRGVEISLSSTAR
jgi:hypothetical protein